MPAFHKTPRFAAQSTSVPLPLQFAIAATGFTLIELVVSQTAIIAILAAMLLPALSKAKQKGLGVACLNNTRQLTIGWLMFPDENDNKLMDANSWLDKACDMTWGNPANTSTGLLAHQHRADRSIRQIGRRLQMPGGHL